MKISEILQKKTCFVVMRYCFDNIFILDEFSKFSKLVQSNIALVKYFHYCSSKSTSGCMGAYSNMENHGFLRTLVHLLPVRSIFEFLWFRENALTYDIKTLKSFIFLQFSTFLEFFWSLWRIYSVQQDLNCSKFVILGSEIPKFSKIHDLGWKSLVQHLPLFLPPPAFILPSGGGGNHPLV